jgi:hypothetical protein
MMLLRDIAVTKTRAALLDRVVLLFMPIYNVDGHERFGPYRRINQNGPRESGWRTTARNLNLNRDYMKADAPEMRAWLSLWNTWQPDLHIDTHTTDGGDWQYDIMPAWDTSPLGAEAVAKWITESLEPHVLKGLEADGHVPMLYFDLVDRRDPTKGIESGPFSPRFATGYASIRNRPSILVETHMLKPYRTRVFAQYNLIKQTLELVNRDSGALKKAVAVGDAEAARLGEYDAARKFVLNVESAEGSTAVRFKGFKQALEPSEISGTDRIVYDSTTPVEFEIPWINQSKVTATVTPPVAYIIPPQWTAAIELLEAHGLQLSRLDRDAELPAESYRLSQPKFAERPFEGRIRVSFQTELVKETRKFPAGSAVISLDQPAARVAIHLLEPTGPDSMVQWGFFNAIFEQKEYAEAYILEKLARDMLAADPALKKEFDEKVASDKEFAADGRARLNFFYKKSPYWDRSMGLYPVARLIERDGLRQSREPEAIGK